VHRRLARPGLAAPAAARPATAGLLVIRRHLIRLAGNSPTRRISPIRSPAIRHRIGGVPAPNPNEEPGQAGQGDGRFNPPTHG